MSRSDFAGTSTNTRSRMERPLGVILIAGLQVLKACILLLAAALLSFNPQAVTSPQSMLYPLLYFSMRGNTSAIQAAAQGDSALTFVLALLGFYIGTLGLSLWSMKDAARRTVRLASGMTLLLYAKTALFPDASASFSSPDLLTVHLAVALEAVVFAYLLRGDTADSFRRSTKLRYAVAA